MSVNAQRLRVGKIVCLMVPPACGRFTIIQQKSPNSCATIPIPENTNVRARDNRVFCFGEDILSRATCGGLVDIEVYCHR